MLKHCIRVHNDTRQDFTILENHVFYLPVMCVCTYRIYLHSGWWCYSRGWHSIIEFLNPWRMNSHFVHWDVRVQIFSLGFMGWKLHNIHAFNKSHRSCPHSCSPLTLACGWAGRGGRRSAAVLVLSTVWEAKLQQPLHVHLVEEFEFSRKLMGFLPFGGELGTLLVVVVVRQLFTCVGVPAKRPEAIKMDLIAHGGCQRVH